MSDDLSAWENATTGGVTTVPGEVKTHDGYVLLLVLLSIFIGGTLVLLFGILIVCRRCCEPDRRHSRASDDPEKTNTTYLDDSQPAQVTIHESNENSIAMTPRHPPAKPSLAIFQHPLPETALTSHGTCASSALPGDTYNSTVEAGSSASSDSGEGTSSDSAGQSPKGAGGGGTGEPPLAPAPGTVLHFFTRLRRHASLEGAGPYFRIKKWKLETSQRASSLDTRGSPKRHQFQRQRAASESMDQEDRDPHQTDIIQYIARTDDVAFRPVSGPFLPAPASSTLSLGRIEPSEQPSPPSAEPPALEPPPPPQPPTPLYHDIWSLRASLEMYASSEQGNDRDSVRSDGGESLSSSGGLPSFSSSLADEAEGGEERLSGKTKQDSVESEAGTRKLLQMDSGYASIEAPGGRVGEDQTASEKRYCFTSAGRRATIFESFEGQEPEEEDEVAEGAAGGPPAPPSPLVWAPYGQLFPTRDTLPRRDYSIDEKTDALFNAFVRHDPQFDDSPLQAKHRSRTHLRKQWQRAKQYSDPGVRYPPALERHRTPLRRGDSVNYPLEGRYQSTLPRIVSAGDEEVAPEAAEAGDKIQVIEEEPPEEVKVPPDPYGSGCLEDGQCPGLGTELMDKITGGLEERMYGRLKKPRESPECVVAVADASPDPSPE
nr:voltage-dependent calcium channel beta subunit-associated regulatory protein [Zootoca vivipara]